jgi:SEC-C motif
MAFLYLAVNIAYLYALIPIPGRNQSWENRMKDWHELTNLMTRRMDDEGPARLQVLLLLVGLGGALSMIYFFRWVPSGLAINVLIVLPCLLSLGGNSVSDELQRGSAALAIADRPGVTGRNDPCPCGSGKGFKHCCGVPGVGTDNVAR